MLMGLTLVISDAHMCADIGGRAGGGGGGQGGDLEGGAGMGQRGRGVGGTNGARGKKLWKHECCSSELTDRHLQRSVSPSICLCWFTVLT